MGFNFGKYLISTDGEVLETENKYFSVSKDARSAGAMNLYSKIQACSVFWNFLLKFVFLKLSYIDKNDLHQFMSLAERS